MTTTVRLLGRPEITTDGHRVPVRGQKSWALLALLALSNRPISRQRVATMLFDRADDPLGALRWTLAQLRRSLGGSAELGGDPLELRRTPEVVLDVDVLANGTWVEALALPGLGETLLAGIDIEASGGFDAWLSAERVRTDAMAAGHLSEAALSGMADGRLDEAARAAGLLVELQPLDEAHHELLVQALAMAGDAEGARRHVAAATRLLTEELGVAPSPTLAAAARVPPGGSARSPSEGRASVIAQLDAGEAAVSAGAIEAGLDCLRRAVHLSARIDDPPLQIRALTSLGSALVHGLRGSDTEGAVTLHHAIAIGQERDEGPATAPAHRELGWVAVQQGRQHQAITWLDRAAELADSPAEHARILGVRGITLDDTGRHRDALETLSRVRPAGGGARRGPPAGLDAGHAGPHPPAAGRARRGRAAGGGGAAADPPPELERVPVLPVDPAGRAAAAGRRPRRGGREPGARPRPRPPHRRPVLGGAGRAGPGLGAVDAGQGRRRGGRAGIGPPVLRAPSRHVPLGDRADPGRHLRDRCDPQPAVRARAGSTSWRRSPARPGSGTWSCGPTSTGPRSAPRTRSRPRPSWPWTSTTPPSPSRPPS